MKLVGGLWAARVAARFSERVAASCSVQVVARTSAQARAVAVAFLRAGRFAWPLVFLAGCALFSPTPLYEKPAMFGTLVVTDEMDGMRTMRFGRNNATQTSIKVGDPDHLQFDYLKLMLAGFAPQPVPRRVLMIGLGGGALPVFMHRHFRETQIDVVEIDPQVISVAKQFFGFNEDFRMKAHTGDGRAFIERAAAGSYDMIILDAFGSTEVPAHLITLEFLGAVRRALTVEGVVVSNVWQRRYNRHYDGMLRTYQEAFGSLAVIQTPRDVNTIFLAQPQAQTLNSSELAARARRLSVEKTFRFNLGLLIEWGLQPAREKSPQVPVLRDGSATPGR